MGFWKSGNVKDKDTERQDQGNGYGDPPKATTPAPRLGADRHRESLLTAMAVCTLLRRSNLGGMKSLDEERFGKRYQSLNELTCRNIPEALELLFGD